jgi:hypothetical protein
MKYFFIMDVFPQTIFEVLYSGVPDELDIIFVDIAVHAHIEPL